jgi:hypothetical protein
VIRHLAQISGDDVASAWRLLRGLPALLRHPLSVDEARAILQSRLERRDERFLTFVGRAVYGNPHSPYRALLSAAGCERGDLDALVRSEGLDEALLRLYRAGVYLTIDEFKGRVPAVRGSTVVHVEPERLYNPLMSSYLAVRSGGTRGRETMVPLGLESIREVAVNQCLSLHARGALGWTHAINGIPGGAATRVVLRHAVFGKAPVRWFSQIDPSAPELHPRYRWSARIMRWSGRLAGVSIPRPEHVPAEDQRPIVDWMAGVLRRGDTPHLRTFASAAVNICRTAGACGVDLTGAQFTLGGEPYTTARRAVVEASGAHAVPNYSTMEAGGPMAYGCLSPHVPDEVHLYRDTHAVVQPGADDGPGGLPARALLVTVLFPASPLVLINASAGDQAELVGRPCGCALEQLGWTTRFHTIRSFEKLTAGGMTFLDRDVIRVLEEVLPGRFGGGPNDYQLVEIEDERGAPGLDLLVSPALGPLDEDDIRRTFLDAIADGRSAERVMSLGWRDAGLVRVARQPPRRTRSGKIFHLHPKKAPAPE